MKEQSLIIMQLKLKSNISLNKSKKLLLSTNPLKEHGKESNIYQLKLKSSTTQKGKDMLVQDLYILEELFMVAPFKVEDILPLQEDNILQEDKDIPVLHTLLAQLLLVILLDNKLHILEDQALELNMFLVDLVPNMLLALNMSLVVNTEVAQEPNMELAQELNMEVLAQANIPQLNIPLDNPNMLKPLNMSINPELLHMPKNLMFQEAVVNIDDFYI